MKNPVLDLNLFGDCLPGEDRSFGGSQFYVDTVPESSWFKNVRSMTTASQWRAISSYVKNRARNRCEICGSDVLLEAHERWSLDSAIRTQKLIRFVCLCKLCHLGTHWGITGALGLSDMVKTHILSITGWSKENFSDHLNELKTQALSDGAWKLDVSMIEAVFLKLQDPGPVVQRKRKELAESLSKTTIQDDGAVLDLSREIRRGFFAMVAETDEQMIGSVPLSTSQNYVAKHPSEIGHDIVHIPLSTFVKAHNNPMIVREEEGLDWAMEDRSNPKRLVVNFALIDTAVVISCLKDALLFSRSLK